MPFSLVLPPPINITITNNTFIRYNNVADGNISIGLVIDIIQEVGYSKVMVRRFLSWYDVQLIAGDSNIENLDTDFKLANLYLHCNKHKEAL